jgi:glycerol-3-phosphate dehydrogenase
MPGGIDAMTSFDVCVIGAGGVVGSAIIREVANRGYSVIGVEAHNGPAQETSGLNSRVVHSGFHEKPGTLKARLALAGSRLLIQYASDKGVPLLRCGMLIAVPRSAIREGLWKEIGSVWHLWRGGRSHDIEFQWIVSSRSVSRIAPIEALGGIFIPSVCVVNVEQLIGALQQDAIAKGAVIRYKAAVNGIVRSGTQCSIHAGDWHCVARSIINSAGLAATTVSRMAGGPEYQVDLIRGEYYELRGGVQRWNIRTLVYPAVPATSPSKGMHLGPRTDGRLFIGPSSVPADGPPSSREMFLDAAEKFLPNITTEDLEYASAGIRPKHTSETGISDFLIRLESGSPPLINLIGIDSPGLSASLGIGKYVGDLVENALKTNSPIKAA